MDIRARIAVLLMYWFFPYDVLSQVGKVLVVGGNGFLGSAICRRLIQAGQQVRVLKD